MRLIDPWRGYWRHSWQPHETCWILAAKSLPFYQRMAAFRDIAELTGLPLSKVVERSKKMGRINRAYRIAAE